MKKYKNLFFDLDRTLWDYEANARDTLIELDNKYHLTGDSAKKKEQFIEKFFVVNEDLWSKFDKGLIDKEHIRKNRFPLVFESLKLPNSDHIENLQEDFILNCPTKGKLINGAGNIVEQLSKSYSLFIITNGFDDIQHIKLEYSGLDKYFEDIITSERAKVQKPDPQIFQFALNVANAESFSALMIGDNIHSDIIGAQSAGIDQVFYNPENVKNGGNPTYEISRLEQLADILL